jgi:dTMP kinase
MNRNINWKDGRLLPERVCAILSGRGKFIVYEGIDGSGTTTQMRLLEQWLEARPRLIGASFFTKEPTEGPVGLLLRQMLSRRIEALEERGMALLFAADRMDHQRDILDRLSRGIHVFSDRYLLSSLAYQSLTVDRSWIENINAYAVKPDITLLFMIPVEESVKRRQNTRNQEELYEEASLLRQIQREYERLAQTQRHSKSLFLVDANRDQDAVFQSILDILIPLLNL